MRGKRYGVVKQRIGGHFRAALQSSPVLGGEHKGFAHPAVAPRVSNEPAFDVSGGMSRIASICVGAHADLAHLRELRTIRNFRHSDWVVSGFCRFHKVAPWHECDQPECSWHESSRLSPRGSKHADADGRQLEAIGAVLVIEGIQPIVIDLLDAMKTCAAEFDLGFGR